MGNLDKQYEKLCKNLDKWDGNTIGFSFNFGKPSNELLRAGIPNYEIRLDATKLKSTLNKHPGLTINEIKNSFETIMNPILVIDSKSNENAKIVLGDLYDIYDKLITVVLLIAPINRKHNRLDIIKISSIQGRSHIYSLFKYANGENVPIRYIDEKRIQNWLNVNRLQLPLRSSNLDSVVTIS